MFSYLSKLFNKYSIESLLNGPFNSVTWISHQEVWDKLSVGLSQHRSAHRVTDGNLAFLMEGEGDSKVVHLYIDQHALFHGVTCLLLLMGAFLSIVHPAFKTIIAKSCEKVRWLSLIIEFTSSFIMLSSIWLFLFSKVSNSALCPCFSEWMEFSWSKTKN